MTLCPVVVLVTHNSYRVASVAAVHANVGVESVVFDGPVTVLVPGETAVMLKSKDVLQFPAPVPFQDRTQAR